jgi:hypothetical protein
MTARKDTPLTDVSNDSKLVTKATSRRRLAIRALALGLGGGLLGMAKAAPVEAADGGNMIIGGGNLGNTRTWLSDNGPLGAAPVGPMLRGSRGVAETFIAAADNVQDGLQGFSNFANTSGVFGRNFATDGVGVWGEASSGTGVFGASGGGSGVSGQSSTASGVFGQTAGGAAAGVRGDNTKAGDANTFGVHGSSVNGTGAGVGVLGTSGFIGGRFTSTGSVTAGAAACLGLSTANDGLALAGFVTGTAVNSLGVIGNAPGGTGLFGETNTGAGFAGRANGNGVAGSFVNNVAGISRPTLAVTNSAATAAGVATVASLIGDVVISNGSFLVTAGVGNKNCTVKTSVGDLKMYCNEATVAVFEDFGRARLRGGSARVELDPLFAEAIVSDYDVYVTPRGASNGLYVESADSSGFTVRESNGGTSNLEFGYRIVGQGKGLTASHRMARVDVAGMKAGATAVTLPSPEVTRRLAETASKSGAPSAAGSPAPRSVGGGSRGASNGAAPSGPPRPRN